MARRKTILHFFSFFTIFLVFSSLTTERASADEAASNAVHYEYSCIDISGQISQCAGNVRPTAFGTSKLAAWLKFVNRINTTGWAEMELVTNGQLGDHQQAYAAGRLEGFVTAKLIRSYRYNLLEEGEGGKDWCTNLRPFISANLNYTLARARSNRYTPYWQQVALVLYQLAGLDDGYASAQTGQGTSVSNSSTIRTSPHMDGIDPCGLILLNLYTEFSDIQSALNQTLLEPRSSHCSAIVKVLPELNEVLVAHNTWTSYKSMLRILKKYTLNFSTSQAKSVAMSSYPGTIFSIDDFYITSTNLVVLETSIENYNSSLWSTYVKPNGIILEFIRNTVANRMASNGEEWVVFYSKLNSGTYNNQFMVVDYKRRGERSGLLTVLEQMPGQVESADLTEHLLRTSYWPSYNVPYFKAIYDLSEQDKMVKQYGDFFTYDRTARALIFKRDHGKVANLSSLYQLMRSNDMFHDPLSKCNCTPPYTGEYAIAARCDLNDKNGRYPIDNLKFRPHGAIDAKLTSSSLVSSLQMIAVSGPTDAPTVPPFSWATTKITDQRHVDQPTDWRFRPVRTLWSGSEKEESSFPHVEFDL